METAMNMDWAHKWLEKTFNQRDMAGMEALYHPKVKFGDVPLGVDADGWNGGLKDFFAGFFDPASGTHQFFPEAYLGNEREGVCEWTWRGTMDDVDLFQLGKSVKGKTFTVRGNSVFRFDAAGKVTEERDYWDLSTVLRQLNG